MSEQPEPNPFRNASNARYLKGLFYEESLDKSSVVYTLKDVPHQGYPSLYQLYMQHADITEYTFATSCLDGWDHWERLCNSTFFKPYVARWRRELEVRLKSEALSKIKTIAGSANKDTLAANRFLLEKGWTGRGKGRPSKAEIQAEAEAIFMTSEKSREADDFNRIFGETVN